jgi:hypothetical protein
VAAELLGPAAAGTSATQRIKETVKTGLKIVSLSSNMVTHLFVIYYTKI